MRDGYLVCLEQMSRKRALKREVSDGIRKVTLGAYRASRIDVDKAEDDRNRRIRNRMYGGEGGRRARALLLPDCAPGMACSVLNSAVSIVVVAVE